MAKGLDQHGREMPVSGVQWQATGGTIDDKGVFCAGVDEGNFVAAAEVGAVRGIANVTIEPKEKMKPPVKLPLQAERLTWSGEIPPQKWMNFYTRVISKFAAEKDLKLEVTIKVSPESGISTQKVEETRTALRELGLNDNIMTDGTG